MCTLCDAVASSSLGDMMIFSVTCGTINAERNVFNPMLMMIS